MYLWVGGCGWGWVSRWCTWVGEKHTHPTTETDIHTHRKTLDKNTNCSQYTYKTPSPIQFYCSQYTIQNTLSNTHPAIGPASHSISAPCVVPPCPLPGNDKHVPAAAPCWGVSAVSTRTCVGRCCNIVVPVCVCVDVCVWMGVGGCGGIKHTTAQSLCLRWSTIPMSCRTSSWSTPYRKH